MNEWIDKSETNTWNTSYAYEHESHAKLHKSNQMIYVHKLRKKCNIYCSIEKDIFMYGMILRPRYDIWKNRTDWNEQTKHTKRYERIICIMYKV